jgi:branched-chain amino acid transport system substrate-binding protein
MDSKYATPERQRTGRPRSRVRYAAYLAGIALLAVIAACSSSPNTSSAQPAATSSGTIIIGSDLEESGPAGSYGTPEVQGAQFYINEIDAKGGVDGRKISLDALDNKSTPTQAVTNFRSLASDNSVVAVFGPALPDTAALMAELAAETKLPLLSFLLSATDQSFNSNPDWFRMAYSSNRTVTTLLQEVHSLGLSKVGLLYADDSGGKAGDSSVEALAPASSVKVSSNVSYPDDVTDPTPEVLQAKGGNPQAYIIWDPDSEQRLGQVVKTMRSNGITAPIFVPEDASLGDFVTAAGSTVSDVYYWASFSPQHPKTADQAAFVAAWQAKYHSYPTDFDSAGYAQAEILVGAIKAVQAAGKPVTRANVDSAIEGLTNLDTVYGPVTYSAANHAEPFATVPVLEYVNGIPKQVAG